MPNFGGHFLKIGILKLRHDRKNPSSYDSFWNHRVINKKYIRNNNTNLRITNAAKTLNKRNVSLSRGGAWYSSFLMFVTDDSKTKRTETYFFFVLHSFFILNFQIAFRLSFHIKLFIYCQ
jgi:hypothetical protein